MSCFDNMTQEEKDTLQQCIQALSEKLPVEEVWLFGSQVKGVSTPDSDIDLLIVLDEDHKIARPHRVAVQCISSLQTIIPVDVFVIKPSDKPHVSGILRTALQEGEKVYAR